MKAFDLGDLKKSAKMQQTNRSKSIADISKSPPKTTESNNFQSFYLSRWGNNLESKSSKEKQQPWINIGQGIYSIAVGQKHAIILNNKYECYACGNNTYGQVALDINQTTRPQQITSVKDMKIVAVYCGSYHSFVQNNKGQIYAFGLNMKGQLGIGTYQNEKKPCLVYSLLPGGTKNPKSAAYMQANDYQKRIRSEKKEGLSDITPLQNLILQVQHKNNEIMFHLSGQQSVVNIACGPLHTIVLTNKGRLLTCGYGQNYTLGHGDITTINQFKQIKIKPNTKIQKIETGMTSFGVLTNSKVYICGKLGKQIYQTLTNINISQQIKDIKITQNCCLMLTKKGDLYQIGQYIKQNGDQYYSQTPRKIERIPTVTHIYSGINTFFALGQNKSIWGWGDNQYSQITGLKSQQKINIPTLIKIPIYIGEQIKLVSGSTTTYLLSSKPLDVDYQKYETKIQDLDQSIQQEFIKKELTKKKSFIKTNQKNILDQIGIQPRTFNLNLQIDFEELVFDKQISQGGYGIIYKGKWRQSTVAIKIFKIESDSAVRDFFSECAAMQALRHPNIVMFLGACTKPPNLAIVLEYCVKGSLWSTIQNLQLPLSWQDRRRFALDTAKGVNYLHSCNPPVIHRDLKSLNLLLDDSYRVKLADFGWTKGLDKYMTGKIGTYQWMAPEVIASQQYSQKADVFSFGIILWQIASRQPPYRNLTGVQVSIQVLNNDLRPPIPKKTPQSYTRLMKKCWDRDPNKRPSFKQIIKELQIMKL